MNKSVPNNRRILTIIIVIFLVIVLISTLISSCGNETSSTAKPVMHDTATGKFHVGQYVYLHGHVKGYIREYGDCGCDDGYKIYRVTVIGEDGSEHTYQIYDENQLSATKDMDTIVVKYIYTDSLIRYVKHAVDEQASFEEDTKDAVSSIRNAVAQDINAHRIK